MQRKGDLEGLRRAAGYSDRMVDRKGGVLDRGAPIRAAAVRALATRERAEGEESLVPLYTPLLDDPSPDVASAAAKALAAEGSAEAAQALVDVLALRGPSLDDEVRLAVREAAAGYAYAGVSERWAAGVLDNRPESVDDRDREELLLLMGADAAVRPERGLFELLAARLAPDDYAPPEAVTAERIVGWCMPVEAGALAAVLERHTVPESAVRLAGLSGDQGLRDPLVRVLQHPHASLRREAADALGALCDTQAVLPLLDATTDPDLAVRKSAVAALDSLGSAGVTAAISVLARAGPPAGDRRGARPRHARRDVAARAEATGRRARPAIRGDAVQRPDRGTRPLLRGGRGLSRAGARGAARRPGGAGLLIAVGLQVEQLRVAALQRHQLLVAALLDHAALVQDVDPVGATARSRTGARSAAAPAPPPARASARTAGAPSARPARRSARPAPGSRPRGRTPAAMATRCHWPSDRS